MGEFSREYGLCSFVTPLVLVVEFETRLCASILTDINAKWMTTKVFICEYRLTCEITVPVNLQKTRHTTLRSGARSLL